MVAGSFFCATGHTYGNTIHFGHSFGTQVKDREAYYIDLQLLRVTKKLQAVLKGDRGEKDKELVQKTEARVEMMERSHESKVGRICIHVFTSQRNGTMRSYSISIWF